MISPPPIRVLEPPPDKRLALGTRSSSSVPPPSTNFPDSCTHHRFLHSSKRTSWIGTTLSSWSTSARERGNSVSGSLDELFPGAVRHFVNRGAQVNTYPDGTQRRFRGRRSSSGAAAGSREGKEDKFRGERGNKRRDRRLHQPGRPRLGRSGRSALDESRSTLRRAVVDSSGSISSSTLNEKPRNSLLSRSTGWLGIP